MRDPTQSLLTALMRDEGGIAVVWCPDMGLREWLVGEVESLSPAGAGAFRAASLDEALARPEQMALLVPDDEREVVLDLDGSRDLLRKEGGQRKQPVVLFLLRDGDGKRALAEEAISLSSWISGSDADPEALADIDVDAERARFQDEIGETPEAWLMKWRNGERPPSGENYARAYRAMLLEEP